MGRKERKRKEEKEKRIYENGMEKYDPKKKKKKKKKFNILGTPFKTFVIILHYLL